MALKTGKLVKMAGLALPPTEQKRSFELGDKG
jgi:hypothetical protein